ncbi:MAG TPA: GGDEF domain-containing protein [Candidatus Edwardsbacteria bacterium]|nr:GGDEF domain-containing protein [Candidatus Edwardsbacteria bacterium]
MIKFSRDEVELMRQCVFELNNWLSTEISNPVTRAIGLQPEELGSLIVELTAIRSLLEAGRSGELTPGQLSILKQSIIHMCRETSLRIEQKSELTFNRGLRARLDNELTALRAIQKQPWYAGTPPARLPILTDFISISYAEKILENGNAAFPDRIFDEKFHILCAPALFLPDLAYFRSRCLLRGVPIVIAYLDIDDFKAFNMKYTEPRIDRDILPKFMNTLEAHVYSRGYAYRYGGDEYIVLLPNMQLPDAISFFAHFQQRIAALEYIGIEEKPTVSIGLFEIDSNTTFTARESETLAAQAKKYAKEKGKNCIAAPKDAATDANAFVVVANGGRVIRSSSRIGENGK